MKINCISDTFNRQNSISYECVVLPSFLNYSIADINAFRGFDVNSFIEGNDIEIIPLCAICLNVCRTPSTPNRCNHIYCYACLKMWEKTKKCCPLYRTYFEGIIKY